MLKHKLQYKNQSINKWVWTVIRGVIAAVCFVTVAGFFGRYWWLFELASFGRLQYTWFLLGSAPLLFFSRQKREAILIAVFALANLSAILPTYLTSKSANAQPDSVPLRALLINVHESREALDPVMQLVQQVQPDLILFSEVNVGWVEAIAVIEQDYPFAHLEPRYAGAGIALFSRQPLAQVRTWDIVAADRPAIVAQIKLERQLLTIVGIHPHPPLSGDSARLHDAQLEAVAAFAKEQPGPVVVLGDLNTTPWSPRFLTFLRSSGLHDGRLGFGPSPTWPVRWFPIRIPLDHFLASPEVVIHDFTVTSSVGSDHLPVYVDFTLKEQAPK